MEQVANLTDQLAAIKLAKDVEVDGPPTAPHVFPSITPVDWLHGYVFPVRRRAEKARGEVTGTPTRTPALASSASNPTFEAANMAITHKVKSHHLTVTLKRAPLTVMYYLPLSSFSLPAFAGYYARLPWLRRLDARRPRPYDHIRCARRSDTLTRPQQRGAVRLI